MARDRCASFFYADSLVLGSDMRLGKSASGKPHGNRPAFACMLQSVSLLRSPSTQSRWLYCGEATITTFSRKIRKPSEPLSCLGTCRATSHSEASKGRGSDEAPLYCTAFSPRSRVLLNTLSRVGPGSSSFFAVSSIFPAAASLVAEVTAYYVCRSFHGRRPFSFIFVGPPKGLLGLILRGK